MQTLYVVTHPQSVHHVEGRVGGWYDTALTDLGRRQAEAIAARLTSDLREMSCGVAEGQPQAWLTARRLPVPEAGGLDDTGGIEGAETRRQTGTRIYRAMDALQADPSKTHIIVTHGFALTFVIAWWIGMPIESLARVNFPVASGSITHLAENAFWKSRAVVTLGDTGHLNGI